jgi:hypothetical protein
MNTGVIEVSLALFWFTYLSLHVWMWRVDPLEAGPVILEVKE